MMLKMHHRLASIKRREQKHMIDAIKIKEQVME